MEESAAVGLQRLEGKIELTSEKIDSLMAAHMAYVEAHKNEHEMLAQNIISAKAELARELHTLNGLKHEMDLERNRLADKDSVLALDEKMRHAMSLASEKVSETESYLDKRIAEIERRAGEKMAELEKRLNASTGRDAGSLMTNARWMAWIAAAITILVFLLKYVFRLGE